MVTMLGLFQSSHGVWHFVFFPGAQRDLRTRQQGEKLLEILGQLERRLAEAPGFGGLSCRFERLPQICQKPRVWITSLFWMTSRFWGYGYQPLG